MSILRIFSLRNITILIYVALLILGIYVYITVNHQNNSKIQMTTGSSNYAALDIVSGDIDSSAKSQILNTLNSVAPENVSWQGINITTGSYHKTYSNSSSIVTFGITIPALKTAYDVGVYGQGSDSQVSVGCSTEQPSGYSCNYPIVGGE